MSPISFPIGVSANQYFSGMHGSFSLTPPNNYGYYVSLGSIGLDMYQKSSETVSLNQNFFKEETKITLNQNS